MHPDRSSEIANLIDEAASRYVTTSEVAEDPGLMEALRAAYGETPEPTQLVDETPSSSADSGEDTISEIQSTPESRVLDSSQPSTSQATNPRPSRRLSLRRPAPSRLPDFAKFTLNGIIVFPHYKLGIFWMYHISQSEMPTKDLRTAL